MGIHAEFYPDKSIIIVDNNHFVGVENRTFQSLVQDSITKGIKSITINLSKVEYIASLGIESLVHAYTTCTNRNIKFNIEGVGGNVLKILHQVKLDTVINIS
ncbi:MAG: STAS domain-containing protein [Ignavibacteriaceae bacterium]|jgi:anti-anti-sigma factor